MDDKMIVELYWERSEAAIAETERKYGKYCHRIAYNILCSDEDAEECVNDTYVGAWNSMPPHRPTRLSTFLGKITRNIALDRYDRQRAQKRSAKMEFIYDEVAEFIPDPDTQGSFSDELALKDAINGFVGSLPRQTRMIFVRRYWYMSSVKEIARDVGLSESNVKVILHRTRADFKAYLEKEGITL